MIRNSFFIQANPILLKSTFLGTLFLMVGTIKAQTVYKLNKPDCDCYSEMLFQENTNKPKGVILLNTDVADLQYFSTHNELFNSGVLKEYNILYVNILHLGNTSPLYCYNVIANAYSNPYADYSINDKVFFIIETDSVHMGYKLFPLKNIEERIKKINSWYPDLTSLKNCLDTIVSKEQYTILNKGSESAIKIYKYNNARNFDIGLFYGPNILFGNRLNTNKSALGTCGLTFMKNLNEHFAIRFGVNVSWKIPSKKAIQSQLQSKIMSAVQDEQDYVYLDENISGHILFGAEFGARYYCYKKRNTRFFVGLGLGTASITNINIHLKDTIDVSDIDMSNPSSLQSSGSLGTSANQESGLGQPDSYTTSMIEFGAETRLSPGAKFGVSMPMRFYKNQKDNATTFSPAINFNLSFVLNPKKLSKRK